MNRSPALMLDAVINLALGVDGDLSFTTAAASLDGKRILGYASDLALRPLRRAGGYP